MRMHFEKAEFGVILTVWKAMPTRVSMEIRLLKAEPMWTKSAFSFFKPLITDKGNDLIKKIIYGLN